MSKKPWYKRYPSDMRTGLQGLTLEERGAYCTLLEILYDDGKPIIDNDRMIAGYLDVSVRKARSIVNSLIESGKLYRTDDGRISNKRFDIETGLAVETSNMHAQNGSEGGRKRAENALKTRRKQAENELCSARNYGESAENANNINGEHQAGLDSRASLYQKPEARSQIPPYPPVVDEPVTPTVERPEVPAPDEIARKELIDLKKGIVAAFRDAGSMTLAPDTHRAERWVAQGYRPAMILAVVREILARHPSVKSLSYFDNPIRDAHDKAAKQPASAAPADEGKRLNFLRSMIREWQREPTSWLPTLGPRPDDAGCTVPANILAEFGIQPRERRAA